MAAAVATLVILPALAGTKTVGTAPAAVITVTVTQSDGAPVPLSTLVDSVLYVGADSATDSADVYNRVELSILDPDSNLSAIAVDTITVNVDGDDDDIDIVLNETDVNTALFESAFFVGDRGGTLAETGVDAGDGVIGAQDGDEITLKFAGRTVKLTVDAEAPDIDDISPDDEEFIDDVDVTFSATVTDSGVGLGDEVDVRTLATLIVDSVAKGAPDTAVEGDDDVFHIEWNLADLDEERQEWSITIGDLVNNVEVEDELTVTLDDTDPALAGAVTGFSWDTDKKKVKTNKRDWIVVIFEGKNSGGDPDLLDCSSVDVGDFVVVGSTIKSVTCPDIGEETDLAEEGTGADMSKLETALDELGLDGSALTGNSLNGEKNDETRYAVFLKLEDKLDSDADPLVELRAQAVDDLAGNDNDSKSGNAEDGIGPGFTISIVAEEEEGTRPIVRGESGRDIEITITSDEDLDDDAIRVFLVTLDPVLVGDDLDELVALGASEVAQKDIERDGGDNIWVVEIEGDDHNFGADFTGLVVVHVIGVDEDGIGTGNAAGSDGVDTDGAVPGAGDDIDFEDADDLGALLEYDTNIDLPDIELKPEVEDGVTQSSRPLIVFDFSERKEYKIDGEDKFDDIELDTHDTITITKIELDGDDVSSRLREKDDDSFVLALTELEEGKYTIEYSARDEVGNKLTDEEFDFEVEERSEYEVELTPGWNLISLPAVPEDPSIDNVLPDSMNADRVLQWVNGAFLVAERGDDGKWDPSGQITEITAGPGYWILTDSFEDIEVLIPEPSPTAVLPTVNIVGGWNLVGVLDIGQKDAGDPPGGNGEADSYFASIDWLIAYSYDTEEVAFTRLVPNVSVHDDDEDDHDIGDPHGPVIEEIFNGKGYWVWAEEAGSLVP